MTYDKRYLFQSVLEILVPKTNGRDTFVLEFKFSSYTPIVTGTIIIVPNNFIMAIAVEEPTTTVGYAIIALKVKNFA
jgi:hypothetical protein